MKSPDLSKSAGAIRASRQAKLLRVWLVDSNGHVAVSRQGITLLAGIEGLFVPAFARTEQAIAWGSQLNAGEHAALVDVQRSASDAALGEENPQRMVDLATRSQLLREAVEAFVPDVVGESVTSLAVPPVRAKEESR
jgi:hypothetical protein